MAIIIQKQQPINAVEVISEQDDALDLEASDLEAYKKTGDVSKLKFIEDKQPTIFLCNFSLKGNQATTVKNSMMGGTDDDGKPVVAFGTWSFRVAKYCLKDIRNPEGLPEDAKLLFKKDEKGLAHDDLIAMLDRVGIVNEIFAMYSALALVGAKANAKN